jgi:hypothetical protein
MAITGIFGLLAVFRLTSGNSFYSLVNGPGKLSDIGSNAQRRVTQRRASSHLHLLSLARAPHFIRQS